MPRQRKRKAAEGPPPARAAWTDASYASLIVPGDVPLLAGLAGLPLKRGVTEADAAEEVSYALFGAIGSLLATLRGGGHSWANVREWLGSVERDAAALLQRLGFDPERPWVERVGRITVVFDSNRPLMDYMQHLGGESFPDDPHRVLHSPLLSHYCQPNERTASQDAVLCVIPECLAVLMLAARQHQVRIGSERGAPWDWDQRSLFDKLAQAHVVVFGRKPVLRDDVGDRGGGGAAWTRKVCELAATQIAKRPAPDAAEVQAFLQSVAGLADATLQDQLGGGRKPRRKNNDPVVIYKKHGGLAALTLEELAEAEADDAHSSNSGGA